MVTTTDVEAEEVTEAPGTSKIKVAILTSDPITILAVGAEQGALIRYLGANPRRRKVAGMTTKTKEVPGNDYLFKTTLSLYNDV